MKGNNIQVVPVSRKSDLKRFINLPYRLYKNNPYWAPPLKRMELATFDPGRNPAYDYCSSHLLLALQNGETVGRVAIIVNQKEKGMARFGWLDFIDDPAVSRLLLNAGEAWARKQGCNQIKGPYGFSNMDRTGLLIEGFEELSTMAVIYNYPYYPDHLDSLGYQKLIDYHEFESKVPHQVPERVVRLAKLIQNRYNLHEYIPGSKSELTEVGRQIFSLINDAYHHLEGFIPYTQDQIESFVSQYISMLNPDFISVVLDKENKLVGFGISMPSFTRALQRAKGKLFPFGFWHMRKAMKQNDRADLYLIAVRPDYQNKGVTAMIFNKLIKTFVAYGIKNVETNPELESNHEVQNLWKDYDIRKHKKRRCYIKTL